MAIINQDKPSSGSTPETYLLIGSGFRLLIGSAHSLIIGASSIAGSFTNIVKPGTEETWGSNTTTWGTETRTWLDMGSLFDNASKPTTSITNTPKP